MGTLAPRYKPKLPSFLAFPIGAEAISTFVRDVPQFGCLELVFSADPMLSATRFRQLIEAEEPHPVLRADFVRWDKRPSIGDVQWVQEYLQGKWSLWAYPVRRTLKATARQALVAEGLPLIVKWLAHGRSPSWYFGRKSCEVFFVPKDGTVRIGESVEAS
jgi:hypothetical protein